MDVEKEENFRNSQENSVINAVDQRNIWIRGCTARYLHFISIGSFISLLSDATLLLENSVFHDNSAYYAGVIQSMLS